MHRESQTDALQMLLLARSLHHCNACHPVNHWQVLLQQVIGSMQSSQSAVKSPRAVNEALSWAGGVAAFNRTVQSLPDLGAQASLQQAQLQLASD